jgi:hypothetical protein
VVKIAIVIAVMSAGILGWEAKTITLITGGCGNPTPEIAAVPTVDIGSQCREQSAYKIDDTHTAIVLNCEVKP